jgi:AraC-like DNA-binding protein
MCSPRQWNCECVAIPITCVGVPRSLRAPAGCDIVLVVSNDPFADILRLTEAKSIVAGRAVAGGTWSLHIPASGQIVFAAILSGHCWLRVDGRKKALRLSEGDVGLLSGRSGFVICSRLSARPIELTLKDTWNSQKAIGEGADCTWLAGRVTLHPSSASLLIEALPSLVLVRAGSPAAEPLQWIVRQLIEEQTSTLPGASIASAQLAQLFFIKILRAHLAGPNAVPRGWLRAVTDERLVHALRLIHGDPSRALGLTELAKAAGMSRTRFAVHFKAVAGVAPLTYLTAWRMRLAQRALREEDTSIVRLASSLGYASESAFSHAFKRVTGVAPRNYRNLAS